MGRRVVALAAQDPDVKIAAAIERSEHPMVGQDAGRLAGGDPAGVEISPVWPESADAAIDFSLPDAVPGLVDQCVARRIPVVLATTGMPDVTHAQINAAAAEIPIVWSPSMSLAVNLTMRLAQRAAEALWSVPGGVDIEIIERHHRYKADAPSGTALKFGKVIADALPAEVEHVHGREGETGQRPRNQIGYHAIRTGDDPGQHTILFGMLGEKLELNVAATSRDSYASGAIAAAKWLQGKPPRLYSMFDVLGLD